MKCLYSKNVVRDNAILLVLALGLATTAHADNSAVDMVANALTQADQALGDFIVVAPYIPEAIGNRVATAQEAAIDWEVACRPARIIWMNGVKEAVGPVLSPSQWGIDIPAGCAARYGDQVNQWRSNPTP